MMPSFDVASEVDLQEVDNTVNQTLREISTRYDFRGSKCSVELDKKNHLITLLADDDYKLRAIIDILQTKAVKRKISLKSFKMGNVEQIGGDRHKQVITLVMGIDIDLARKMVKDIKSSKIRVQAQIQEEKVRVNGKKRDDLQEIIALLKSQDFGIPLQFVNYRD